MFTQETGCGSVCKVIQVKQTTNEKQTSEKGNGIKNLHLYFLGQDLHRTEAQFK